MVNYGVTDEAVQKKKKKTQIDLSEALTFVAKEHGWLPKLVIILVLGFISTTAIGTSITLAVLPLIPPETFEQVIVPVYPQFEGMSFSYDSSYYGLVLVFLVGLAPTALLAGYYIDVVRRVGNGAAELLPTWTNLNLYFVDGAKMVGAYILYMLAMFLLVVSLQLFSVLVFRVTGQALLGLFLLLCVTLPGIIVLSVAAIFFTSICVVPYSASGRFLDFFSLGWAIHQLRHNRSLTLRWFGLGVGANLGFSAIQSLPVVGFVGLLLSLALQVPIQGHLLGQYAALVLVSDDLQKKS